MGAFRLLLALVVAAGHSGALIPGLAGLYAYAAVQIFFVISGFYMALVLNEVYRTDADNRLFYLNRAIRIFPMYWLGLVLTMTAAWSVGVNVLLPLEQWTAAGQILFVFSNLFIFGQDLAYSLCIPALYGQCANAVHMTINPPAWSIAVELVFYLAAPFIVRSPLRSFLLLAAGIAYLVALDAFDIRREDIPHAYTYFALPASFIFFGAGALSYHLWKSAPGPSVYAGLALVAVMLLFGTPNVFTYGAVVLAAMFALPRVFELTRDIKFDAWLGELSYPVYILHFAFVHLGRVWFPVPGDRMWFVMAATTAASIVAVLTIERSVSALRARIRAMAGRQAVSLGALPAPA